MHTIKKVRVALLRNAVAKEMAHLGYADPRQRRTRSTDPREKTEKQKEERVTRWTVLATKTKKLLILPLAQPISATRLRSSTPIDWHCKLLANYKACPVSRVKHLFLNAPASMSQQPLGASPWEIISFLPRSVNRHVSYRSPSSNHHSRI